MKTIKKLSFYFLGAFCLGAGPGFYAQASCVWKNPVTDHITPLTLEEDQSCHEAQQKAQTDHIDKEYKGDELAYRHAIELKNAKGAHTTKSASEQAENSADLQKTGGMVAMGGAAFTGNKAYACCSATPACPSCDYWVLATAGLLGAGGLLYTGASSNYKNADYLGANPYFREPANGDGSNPLDSGPELDPLAQNPTMELPPFKEEKFTMNEEEFDKKDLETEKNIGTGGHHDKLKDLLKKLKAKWDPKQQKLTRGKKDYFAKDLDSALENLPASAVQQLKDHMSGLQSQLAKQAANAAAAEESEEENSTTVGGGGSFKGYGGGGSFGGGGRGRSHFNPQAKHLMARNNSKAQKVAGMGVKHGRDQVGTSMDNIFMMIHRRYQKKRAGKAFFENMNH